MLGVRKGKDRENRARNVRKNALDVFFEKRQNKWLRDGSHLLAFAAILEDLCLIL